MSELTTCNHCTLKEIRRRAKKAGRKVKLGKDEHGWITVTVGDDAEPCAYFLELTSECVC